MNAWYVIGVVCLMRVVFAISCGIGSTISVGNLPEQVVAHADERREGARERERERERDRKTGTESADRLKHKRKRR